MAVLKSQSFDALTPDETLASQDADWSDISGNTYVRQSGSDVGISSHASNVQSFTALSTMDATQDGYIQCKRISCTARFFTLALRGSGTFASTYRAYSLRCFPNGSMTFRRLNGNGGSDQLGDTIATGTHADGDTVRLEVEGHTLRAYVNGSLVATHTESAKTVTADGRAYVIPGGNLANNGVLLDDVEIGTLSAGGLTATFAAAEAGADALAASISVQVTGDLAGGEGGADTCAASAQVGVDGSLAAAETGVDVCAATIGVSVSGDLTAVETGADGVALAAAVLVLGDLSVAETAADAAALGVGVVVVADLASAEDGADTLFATIGQVLGATLSSAEEGADGFTGSASTLVVADLQVTEVDSDTAAASVLISVSAGLAVVETGADALSASIGEPPETGAGAVFASPVFRSRVVTGVAS